MSEAVTDVRQISHIAYGFMGSKALFAALHLDLFSHLADGPLDVEALSRKTGVAEHRLNTLLHALTGLGLVTRTNVRYANAPASQRYLVRGGTMEFADYYRFQIDRIIYPALLHLDEGLSGQGGAYESMRAMLSDPAQADDFSRAQHAGSLGPAHVFAKTVDLGGCRHLLDVAGGSGAFAITLCQRHPDLSVTLIDFPPVVEVARRYVREAALEDRISLVGGDALDGAWPGSQDAVLMSYLLSAVQGRAIETLIERAWTALRPGGRVFVHDFMLGQDGDSATAALWFLQYLSFQPDAVSFDDAWLGQRLAARGFTDIQAAPLIPEITKLVQARKPDRSR